MGDIVTCCKLCNSKKGDSIWKPRTKPIEPNSYQLEGLLGRLPLYEPKWVGLHEQLDVLNELLSIGFVVLV